MFQIRNGSTNAYLISIYGMVESGPEPLGGSRLTVKVRLPPSTVVRQGRNNKGRTIRMVRPLLHCNAYCQGATWKVSSRLFQAVSLQQFDVRQQAMGWAVSHDVSLIQDHRAEAKVAYQAHVVAGHQHGLGQFT